jgi:hypothetical protein
VCCSVWPLAHQNEGVKSIFAAEALTGCIILVVLSRLSDGFLKDSFKYSEMQIKFMLGQ